MVIIDTGSLGAQQSVTASTGGAAATTALSRLEQVLGTPVTGLSVHDLRRQMHLVRSVQAIAQARLIELHDELLRQSTTPGTSCGGIDPRREVRLHGGLRHRELRSLDTQTAAVTAAPLLGDLLAAGVTTAAHIESVGEAITLAGDGAHNLLGAVPTIAERAATMSVDDFDRYVKRLARDAQPDDGLSQFEQQRRSTHVKMRHGRDGMLRFSGAYDPERGAAIAGRLDHHIETMFHGGDDNTPLDIAPGIEPNDHRRAIALHALCTGRPSIDSTPGQAVHIAPTRAEVIVHVDLATLQTGRRHPDSTCRTNHGTDIPPHTARRLACDNDIIPIVLDSNSVPLDVGRSKRLATTHQRRALESIYTTCAIDGCDIPFTHCAIHHLHPWEAGGATDLANLLPLCTRHHHAAHEGGWQLQLDPTTRHLHITLPTPAHSPPTHPLAHTTNDHAPPRPPP